MQLVERREMIELFLKELLCTVDYELYEPLSLFIEANRFISILHHKLKIIIKVFRMNVAKKSLNQRLFRFYSKELLNFVYRLENGIEVMNIDDPHPHPHPHPNPQPQQQQIEDNDDNNNQSYLHNNHNNNNNPLLLSTDDDPYVLWLDICEEPGLSRICLAPRSIFELSKDYEDERLANGIFLSDIAEIRRGASSHSFRCSRPRTRRHNIPPYRIEPEKCLSIIGSERTIAIQLTDNDYTNSNNSRLELIDLLSLYSLQSLTSSEIKARGRRFRRLIAHFSVKQVLPRGMNNLRADAERICQLLVHGIDVDEENFSPHFGTRIVAKHLSYDETTRQLHLRSPCPSLSPQPQTSTPPTDNEDDMNSLQDPLQLIQQQPMTRDQQVSIVMPHLSQYDGLLTNNQDRTIDLDDISEVRPGKVSVSVDGSEDLLYVSIIASQSIIVLPVPSLTVRDNLVSRFQAFVTVYRDYQALDCDSPTLFLRPLETADDDDFTPNLGKEYEQEEDLVAVSSSSYLTPPTKSNSPQTMKVTFSNLSAKNAEDNQRISSNNGNNGGGSSSSRRRHSASSSTAAAAAAVVGEVSSGTVYSHTKRTKSISILRRSSTSSSRGQSSLSEAFTNNYQSLLTGSGDYQQDK